MLVTEGFEELRDGVRAKIGYGAIGTNEAVAAIGNTWATVTESDPPDWVATSELIRSATDYDEYFTISKANAAGVEVDEIAFSNNDNTKLIMRHKLSAATQKTASMAWRVTMTVSLEEG